MSPNASSFDFDDLHRRAEAVKSAWAGGHQPDAGAALREYPELVQDKSVVLDLAYEEFCLRCEAGEAPNVESFVRRLPAYHSSARRMLAAHQFLASNPGLVELTTPRWPAAGEPMGDLTLGRELGRGGFARVFLAREESTNRAVVVKMSAAGAAEARTLGPLGHTSVVKVYWARHDPDRMLWVVCMPYLGAATLHDLIDHAFPKDRALPPQHAGIIRQAVAAQVLPGDPPVADEAAGPSTDPEPRSYVEGVRHVAGHLAAALAYLHARGIYHRDLKPSNVLLSPDGRPRLLDFNLAADASSAAGVGGTLPYMAPEQLRAFRKEALTTPPAGPADMFALGLMVYELLTGVPPFGRPPAGKPTEQAAALLARYQSGFRPLRQLNRQVPARMARLIERCLALEPAWRPTATEVAAVWLPRRGSTLWQKAFGGAGLALAAGVAVWAVASGTRSGESMPSPPVAPFAQLPRPEELSPEELVRRGQKAYAEKDYGKAVSYLERAIPPLGPLPVPGLAQACFDLGRARMKLADVAGEDSQFRFGQAISDFDRAKKHWLSATPQGAKELHVGQAYACIAYCLARIGSHDQALASNEKAIKAGYDVAVVHNNLGFSRQLGNPANRAKAPTDCGAAIRIARTVLNVPTTLPAEAAYSRRVLQAAYHNRARFFSQPEQAVAARKDYLLALAADAPNADLCYDAACNLVDIQGDAGEVVRLLRDAVRLGKAPQDFQNQPRFQQLQTRADFAALAAATPASAPFQEARLVDPVLDLLPEGNVRAAAE